MCSRIYIYKYINYLNVAIDMYASRSKKTDFVDKNWCTPGLQLETGYNLQSSDDDASIVCFSYYILS